LSCPIRLDDFVDLILRALWQRRIKIIRDCFYNGSLTNNGMTGAWQWGEEVDPDLTTQAAHFQEAKIN